MLRPTESSILWLQQFGRGLRKTDDDKRLTVIDYIGNHRTFLLTPHAETAVNGARRRPPLSDGPVLHDQSGIMAKWAVFRVATAKPLATAIPAINRSISSTGRPALRVVA